MKKSEITVGENYAYESYQNGRRECVKVIKADAEVKESFGRTYKGWLVRTIGGNRKNPEFIATSRQIVCPWPEEAQRIRDRAAMAEQSRLFRYHRRERLAPQIKAVNDLLLALGHGEEPQFVPGNQVVEEVAQHAADLGFHVFCDSDTAYARHRILLASESLAGLLAGGTSIAITLDDAVRLAAVIDLADLADEEA